MPRTKKQKMSESRREYLRMYKAQQIGSSSLSQSTCHSESVAGPSGIVGLDSSDCNSSTGSDEESDSSTTSDSVTLILMIVTMDVPESFRKLEYALLSDSESEEEDWQVPTGYRFVEMETLCRSLEQVSVCNLRKRASTLSRISRTQVRILCAMPCNL